MLEQYAKEKEQEKEALIKATRKLYRLGELDVYTLTRAMEKAYILGHNAGHCRGEQYRTQQVKEMI